MKKAGEGSTCDHEQAGREQQELDRKKVKLESYRKTCVTGDVEELGSVIFLCSDDTLEEHLQRQLLGLTRNCLSLVQRVRPGMPLFLYNLSDKNLYGVFEATSNGALDIEPSAWASVAKRRSGCPFPAQVRCRERGLRSAVPLAQFRKLLKFVSGPRFELAVDIPTTDKLLALFAANAPAAASAQKGPSPAPPVPLYLRQAAPVPLYLRQGAPAAAGGAAQGAAPAASSAREGV